MTDGWMEGPMADLLGEEEDGDPRDERREGRRNGEKGE